MNNTSIQQEIIDFSKITNDNFSELIECIKNNKDLCFDNKTNESNTIYLIGLGMNIYNNSFYNKTKTMIILYNQNPDQDKTVVVSTSVYNHKNIVAFAIIDIKDLYVELKVLCGNKNKQIKYKDKPLGIYLLNYIYSNYVNDKLFVIVPDNPALFKYYISWKTPLIPNSQLNNFKNENTIIYGNPELIDTHFSTNYIQTFTNLNILKQYLKLEDSDLEEIKTNELSDFILNKINKSNLDPNTKLQLIKKAKVSYHNLIELKKLLKMYNNDPNILISSYENENNGGGKRKSSRKSHKKKTRRNRRKSVHRNRNCRR